MSDSTSGRAVRLEIQRLTSDVEAVGIVSLARRSPRPRGIELARAMRAACEALATARARREPPSSPVVCARCERDYQYLLVDCDSVARTGMCGFCALPEVADDFREAVLREDARYRACESALSKITADEMAALGLVISEGVLRAVEGGHAICRVVPVGEK